METALCYLGAIFVIGFVFLANAIRIVPEHQRLVIFRLGRALEKAAGPGIVFLLPMLDRAVKVDLHEQVRAINAQQALTKEGIRVMIDYVWHYKILDPVASVLQVGNFEVAAQGMALTAFRAIIGEIEQDDLPQEREHISALVRARLDEVASLWGVKVTNFDFRRVVVDDRQLEMSKAKFTTGTVGEAQTSIHAGGSILVEDQVWDSVCDHPIASGSKVRVKRVVLEVEEISASSS